MCDCAGSADTERAKTRTGEECENVEKWRYVRLAIRLLSSQPFECRSNPEKCGDYISCEIIACEINRLPSICCRWKVEQSGRSATRDTKRFHFFFALPFRREWVAFEFCSINENKKYMTGSEQSRTKSIGQRNQYNYIRRDCVIVFHITAFYAVSFTFFFFFGSFIVLLNFISLLSFSDWSVFLHPKPTTKRQKRRIKSNVAVRPWLSLSFAFAYIVQSRCSLISSAQRPMD